LVDVISQHHARNADSPHKTAITIVALANLYARILVNEHLSQFDMENKEGYIKTLSITNNENDYYSIKFKEDVQKEDLYVISTELQ
jgi:hypothetical protein